MPLPTYIAKCRRLSVNTAHGRACPHRVRMLLTLFAVARAGALPDNRILYAPPLLERILRFVGNGRGCG